MRGWFLTLALVGCTDYTFAPGDKSSEGGTYDSSEGGTGDDSAPGEGGTCDDPAPEDYAVTPDEACLREPSVGSFDPVIEWQWWENTITPGYDQVMAAPAVGELTDDNGDGRVDTGDVPDVVFAAFSGGAYTSAGALVALSGDGSGELWSITEAGGHPIYGASGVAIGDIDADGFPDVCAAGADDAAAVVCVEGRDGSLKWAAGTETNRYGCPALADLDGDGMSEVIFGRQIFDAYGNLLGKGAYGSGGNGAVISFAVDWDGDDLPEVVTGNAVYELDGTAIMTTGGSDGYPATGDFDGDGAPDLVVVGGGVVSLYDNAGTLQWQSAVPGGGNGGPPTVADFDGDDLPEVGVAGQAEYSVFDTDGSVLWSNEVQDYSSSQTGSSVFDFEGDGRAEVVYADELTLWVFAGPDGTVRMEQDGHASGTLMEYPVIADVDGDGSTEIVVAANNYAFAGWKGITVVGDATASWAPAREIWNQHAYFITNVNDDGSIPARQEDNWLSWNNFRAGGTILGPSDWLADVGPEAPEVCTDACWEDSVTLYVPVRNTGLLDAPGVTLTLQQSTSGLAVATEAVGTVSSGEAVYVGPITLTRDEWGEGLEARVGLDPSVEECDSADNVIELGAWPCDAETRRAR